MPNKVQVSVRSLVEFVMKEGSIDARFSSRNALAEGTRLHQKIQKTYDENDQKEVYLQAEILFNGITYVVDGRCDGLLFRNDGVIVDEIKSSSRPLEDLPEEGIPVHWAQAKMYAYMYSKVHGLNEMAIQLTYIHTENEAKKYFQKKFTFTELEFFVFDMLEKYEPYAAYKLNHIRMRDESCKELLFPFPFYRKGQRKLAGAVYKTIVSKKSLFAKAPTGIGKTISTLFPAVKAIGEGHLHKIFYLTAKTITRTTAEEALAKMRSSGLCLTSVTITAKDKICFKEETICQKEYCEYANGYYDRINNALLDILQNEDGITRQVLEKYAQKHKVCPFEFSIDLAYEADAVVGDYNYIFDPRVSLKRLLEEQKKSTALLIDEAHNLVDRGREMFSACLHKSVFLQLKREFKDKDQSVFQAANKINSSFIALRKTNDEEKEFVLEALDESLLELLKEFMEAAESRLPIETSQNLLDAYFEVKNFLAVAKMLDDSFVIYAEKIKNDLKIKLFCMNPAEHLKQMGKGYRSKIFFSATLSPIKYFQDILGGEEDDFALSLPSPFRKEQIDVYIEPLSTRYRDRDRTKSRIVLLLKSLLKSRPGNYLIFFPSYLYLLSVYELFQEANEQVNVLIQKAGMTEEEKEAFLEKFNSGQGETLIGFAVLGGIFSEGIDLIGDRLNGVVVVGVGMPQICFERNLIKDYFDKQGRNGFDYAYVYPGMNKVLQAGGRLIRSEEDEGTIVLIDDRFLQKKYKQLLPPEWVNK